MKICKNKITDVIRTSFGANPLRVPRTGILPLKVLEIINEKPVELGHLKFLIQNDFNLEIPIESEIAANVANVTTKNVDIKFGFKVLSGFLKALDIDPAVVSASLKSNKTLSFSFENVVTKHIDLLQFGQILNKNQLIWDDSNFSIQSTNSKQPKLALVTRVLQSNNFSIKVFKDKGVNGKVNIPVLEEYLADVKMEGKIQKKTENEIKFNNKEHLTFAFSCVEILIDTKTKKLKRGNWLDSLKGMKENQQPIINTLDFGIALAEPELLDL